MSGYPGNWNEPDGELLDKLTRHGKAAADTVVIGMPGASGSEKTRAGVRAALRLLLANGLVTAVPAEQWPEYVTIDPPGAAWTT
jgi:hypothetical protein